MKNRAVPKGDEMTMRNAVLKMKLKEIAARGARAWMVGLVVLGLTPAAPARAEPERTPVPERIERIRTALDERGPDTLGSLATVLPAAEEDSDKKKKKKKPPNWDDWDDWNDWADF